VPLTLTELDRGSWVIFELPGFTTAASGAPQDSLDALRQASVTSYYKGQDSLWVKVVSSGDAGTGAPGGGTSVQVSRYAIAPSGDGRLQQSSGLPHRPSACASGTESSLRWIAGRLWRCSASRSLSAQADPPSLG
jgi:hypothetical protein